MLRVLKRLGVVWVVFWVCLLPALGAQTEEVLQQQRQETPRPILDAPLLRIPAMPSYETSIQELGYKDIDQLLDHSVQAQSSVWSLSVAGEGLLASGSSDGTVKLWDVGSGELKRTLQAQSSVWSLSVVGEGLLASGSDDGTVKLWDVGSGELKRTLQAQSRVNALSMVSEDSLASGSSDGTVKLWDIGSGELKRTLQAHQNWVRSLSVVGEGLLASGSDDGTVKLWDIGSGELKHMLQAHQDGVTTLSVVGEGLLASGSSDGTVKLWDVGSGELKRTLQAHQNWVRSLSVVGEGLLASGSDDGTVKLWDVGSGELKRTLQAQSRVMSLSVAGEGLLASGSLDGTVMLWDVNTGELKHTLQAQSRVMSLSVAGEGLLASGSDDGTVMLWDVNTGELKHTLQAQSRVLGEPWLAISSRRMWDVHTGKLKRTLQAQRGLTALSVVGEGVLAGGFEDGTVKLWDVNTGELRQVSMTSNQGAWITIKADGRVLRAEHGQLLRRGTVLSAGNYPVEVLETDRDGKPTDKILTKQENYKSTEWQYLPAPTSQITLLNITLDKPLLNTTADKANQFTLSLTNTGSDPIHRPHILETTSSDGKLRIVHARPEPTYPQSEALYSSYSLIPAGKTITLAAYLVAANIEQGEYEIPIKVEVSGGATQEKMLKVKIEKPLIEIKEQDYSFSTNSVVVQLHNRDIKDLPHTQLYLVDSTGRIASQSLAINRLQSKTDSLPLAFQLKDDISWWQLPTLKLAINPDQPSNYISRTAPVNLNTYLSLPAGLALLIITLLGLSVFYFRRYRHPLVLELSTLPKQLNTLPLEQLGEAQQRLQQTGRFKTILETAEVSTQTFNQALDFAKLTPEQKAQVLAKRLGAQITEQLTPELFTLKLPDNFILNVNRLLLYFPTVSTEDVFTTLRALTQAEGRITLIINTDTSYQRKLLNTTQDRSNKYVAPQSKQLTELLLSPKPEAVLAKVLAEQLALQQLSPYQIGSGVNKEALFFGRRELIAQIINRDPANYLIVGGRQMGKSSLLKALERRYEKSQQVSCVYIALSKELHDPISKLSDKINLEADNITTFAAQLEVRTRMEQRSYLFLIDEADLFIEHEQKQGYPILSVFRRLSEQGQCSFILAGFWQLYQHAVLDYQSPLRNFGEVLEVGALEQEACEQLATIPMQTLNLSYANPQIVQHMISQCGQRANHIAYICHQIIQQLEPSQRIIEVGDVHKVLSSRELQKRLTGWSVGIGDTEQVYDRLVVYSTIDKDSFTTGELMQYLEQAQLPFNTAELERTLSRLELAFVLGKEQQRWVYRVPLFVDMMRQDDLAIIRENDFKQWAQR